MITLSTAVFLVIISVSEQQRHLNFDQYGQFIDSVQGSRFNLPPSATRDLPDQYGYEVSNGKLVIKPCATRRAMPENWGYPMQVNAPLARRTGQPIRKDIPKKPLNNAILNNQFSPVNTEANQYEVSSLLVAQSKPQTTTEPEQINDYELESDNEAAEHIIKHNEAVPSHGDSQYHPAPVKDENMPTTTTPNHPDNHPVNQPAKEKNIKTHDDNQARPSHIENVEAPNEYMDSKKTFEHPYQNDSPSNHEAKVFENPCVQKKPGNTQSVNVNFATNSRRSMDETPEMRNGPITSRVPASTMKRFREQKRLEKDTENSASSNNDNDDSNRHGYPSSLLPYSPGLIIASSPVAPRNGPIIDPTKGVGIAPLRESQLAMMESPRVCYACTTLNDPSCHYPQRGTTVKYCRPGHNSCLTKTVKGTSTIDQDLIVIRDCGELCDAGSTASLVASHSCSICNGDLCNDTPVDNGALTFTPLSVLLVFIITWSVSIVI